MRVLIYLSLVIILAACSRISLDDLSPSHIQQGHAPKFGDRKPHEWLRRAPWTYPVHGTDVSKYQGEIQWHELKRSGISFAFIKATEGGDRVDDFFHRNWQGAKA